MAGGRDWTRKEEETAYKLATVDQWTYAAIATLLHRTRHSVALKVGTMKRKRGTTIERYRSPRKPGELSARIKQLWRPGIADIWLANLLDCHRTTITHTRNRLGIPSGIKGGKPPRIRTWLRRLSLEDKTTTTLMIVRMWEYSNTSIALQYFKAHRIKPTREQTLALAKSLSTRRSDLDIPTVGHLQKDNSNDEHCTQERSESHPRIYRIER